MQTTDVKITLVTSPTSLAGNNFWFTVEYYSFAGLFRISYYDESRKNASYKKLTPSEAYFEKTIEPMRSTYLTDATDTMLFVERKKAWILDILQDQLRKRENQI